MRRSSEDIYHLNGRRHTGAADGTDTGFRHSTHYHSFFEGYTEVRVEKEKGGYRVERYYTAPWYICTEEKRDTRRRLLFYWISYLLSAGVFFWCTSWRIESNYAYYVAAPGFLTAIIQLLFFFFLCSYCLRKEKMTLYEYKHKTAEVRNGSMAACIATGITAAMTGLFFLTHISWSNLPVLLQTALLAGASAGMYWIRHTENKVPYAEAENHTKAPEGGFVIR